LAAACLLLFGCRAALPTGPTATRSGPVPSGPEASQGPRLARSRFLAFGDSLTAGTTSPSIAAALSAGPPQSYPFQLLLMLTAEYPEIPFEVFNEGKAGEASDEGAKRLPELVRSIRPEVVILLHGINDVSSNGVTRTIANINSMARNARLAGADVIITTMPPERAGSSRAIDPDMLARFNDGLRDMARGEDALLVDLAAEFGDTNLIGFDGLHPTDAGYRRIATLIFQRIRSAYE
jgi:lysophospholipase L1-like esterase